MNDRDVQQKARQFIVGLDTSNIVRDLSVYLDKANAKVRHEELNRGESGYTVTKPSGRHVITINSLESEERQRFTVCHEIAHIILGLASNHSEVPSWAYAKRDPNERLCDVFAAELLMPYRVYRSAMPVGDPSLCILEKLASDFNVSFPAAASRYAALASIPCAFVTMERDLIRHAARSTSLTAAQAWIAPRTLIPPGSVAHRLRASKISSVETDEVSQDIWFSDWEKGLDLWEMARYYERSDTAVSLLWFEPDLAPSVESNRYGVRVVEGELLSELTGELPWPGKRRRK